MPKRPPRVSTALPAPAHLRELAARGEPVLAGPHRLGEVWIGDAVRFLQRLPARSVDLVIADPPYAIDKAAWDTFTSLDAYVDWCDVWLAEVHRVLAPHGTAYVCGFSEILAEVKVRSARRFAACKWLIWYYRNKANLGRDWGRSHESILHLRVSKATQLNVDDVRIPYNEHTKKYPARVQAESSQFAHSGRRDTWQPHPLGAKPRDVFEIPVLCNGQPEKLAHPTQKPEALIEKFVLASSAPGQLVVDPFSGSGTTAAVAARLGRRFCVVDQDPSFVQLTLDRLGEGLGGSAR